MRLIFTRTTYDSLLCYRRGWGVLLVAVLMITFETSASGVHVAVGLGAVEEGDDRPHPVISLGLSLDPLVAKFHAYGRDFGAVEERTKILSIGKYFPLAMSKAFRGVVGLVAMQEETTITGVGGFSEGRYNFGVLLGVGYVFGSRFQVSLDWDAHLFLAGTAGLFLATGRKEVIGLNLGYDL